MKNSDFIKMTSVSIYSLAFPTDKLVETLENATFDTVNDEKLELIRNPITGEKVHKLGENGLFFSLRAEYKPITATMLTSKTYAMMQDNPEGLAEDELQQLAYAELMRTLPAVSEIYNVFYNTETQLLIMNNRSKRAKKALIQLIELFGLAGVKSVIVSDEKLGLNKKFEDYLNHGTPLFKGVEFDFEATLVRENADEKAYLTCKHVDQPSGKEKALQALKDGFAVQSLKMNCLDDVKFKLDRQLEIRSMRWTGMAKTANKLDRQGTGCTGIFYGFIQNQFDVLNRIEKHTLLTFTQDTKLETFA
ncbi:hypothetical protein FW755_03310 [Lonepinella koalarum]|uniref:recombination-associated protein RdgC n=1 Tax=Lonepinella koalarum TaxID=53417 RepID=UPI0011E45CC1|nr:recombination-associated protein RdgC [Lonepinella koalarum]TYG34185.1 hypothetical protein FW755_03310 [Lonepinella koalarum]